MSSRRDPERLPGQDEREPISIGEDRRKNEEIRELVKAWTSAHPQYCTGPAKGHEVFMVIAKVEELAARKDAENTKKILTLREELSGLRRSHSLLIQANNDVIETVNEEKKQKRALERELAERDADLKELREKRGNVDEELQEARAQCTEKQQRMDQLVAEYSKELRSLRRKLKKSKDNLEEEKRKSSQYAAFLAVDSTHAAVGNEKTPTDVVVEHMKVEKSILENKLKECRDEVDALAANLAAEKRNSEDLQHQLAQREASSHRDSKRIRDQIQESNRKIRGLEVEKSVLVCKNRDLEGQNRHLEERKKELTDANQQLRERQAKLERNISRHITDHWTADVTSHHCNVAAERERWEALENRNTELEMTLSRLQQQYQWKANDYQILERLNDQEAQLYREERERWMSEKEFLDRQLAEKEKLLDRKSAELVAKQQSFCVAEDENKQLCQKLHEKETDNKLLQKQLRQLTDNRGVKPRHQPRSRTSSLTQPSLSSVESDVSMSSTLSTASARERLAALESFVYRQHQLQQVPRRRPVTYTQGTLGGDMSDRHDRSESSTLTESFPPSHTSCYPVRSQSHLLSSSRPLHADSLETSSNGRSLDLPPFDPNLVCPKCNKQFRHGEIQKLKSHYESCTKR